MKPHTSLSDFDVERLTHLLHRGPERAFVPLTLPSIPLSCQHISEKRSDATFFWCLCISLHLHMFFWLQVDLLAPRWVERHRWGGVCAEQTAESLSGMKNVLAFCTCSERLLIKSACVIGHFNGWILASKRVSEQSQNIINVCNLNLSTRCQDLSGSGLGRRSGRL